MANEEEKTSEFDPPKMENEIEREYLSGGWLIVTFLDPQPVGSMRLYSSEDGKLIAQDRDIQDPTFTPSGELDFIVRKLRDGSNYAQAVVLIADCREKETAWRKANNDAEALRWAVRMAGSWFNAIPAIALSLEQRDVYDLGLKHLEGLWVEAVARRNKLGLGEAGGICPVPASLCTCKKWPGD